MSKRRPATSEAPFEARTPGWSVIFHDDFDPEFDALDEDVKDELLAAAKAVQSLGPAADRPTVGTLGGSKHGKMKERRFKAHRGSQVWRAAFAFDPERNAIVLCAADKQGRSERAFYKTLIAKADARFDTHLAGLRKKGR